jgi:hypothetical protein
LIGGGVLAAAAGAVAFGIFAGATAGVMAAFEGLGRLGDRFGPGYRDLLQGTAGMAALLVGPKVSGAKITPRLTDNVAPGPANFMDGGDRFFLNASKRTDIDPNGFFDVIAHGSPTKIEIQTANGPVLVNHRIAARLIKQSPGYRGQNVRLLSCSTGARETGFAQNLANKLGVEVHAPTDLLWAYPDGRMVVAPMGPKGPNLSNLGDFQVFRPLTQR